jgi:hypothetical protein
MAMRQHNNDITSLEASSWWLLFFCRSALAVGALRWHDIKYDVNGGEAYQPSLLTLSQGIHEATIMEYWCLKSSFSYDNTGSFIFILQCSISLQTRHARRFWFWGFKGCESNCCTIQMREQGYTSNRGGNIALAIAAISGMINDK